MKMTYVSAAKHVSLNSRAKHSHGCLVLNSDAYLILIMPICKQGSIAQRYYGLESKMLIANLCFTALAYQIASKSSCTTTVNERV
jgi:hypothetical protein